MQPVEFGESCRGRFGEFFSGGELNIFFAEVEFEFKQSGKLGEVYAQLFEASREFSAELAEGETVGGCRSRRYHVGHSFSLREVKTSVEECAAREFARFGKSGALAAEDVDEGALEPERAVDRKLHGVFACKRVRADKERGYSLVEPQIIGGINNGSEMSGMGFRIGKAPSFPDRVGYGYGVWAAEAHYGYA